MSDKIILLDMDGTITTPRGRIELGMLRCLQQVAEKETLAIVSGSDIEYMLEQCGNDFIERGIAPLICLMPCNGTKVYKFDNERCEYSKVSESLMRNEIGNKHFKNLISSIVKAQAHISWSYKFSANGEYVSDRKSTLNWSLIGRGCTAEERRDFSSRPDNVEIRTEAIDAVRSYIRTADVSNLEFVLGGQTSVDIYPKGWDKTFALRHFEEDEIYFVGDKCSEGENDFHLYEALKESGTSFETSGPEETISILNHIMAPAEEKLIEAPEEVMVPIKLGPFKRFVAIIKSWWYKLLGDRS